MDKPASLDYPIHDLLRQRWSPRAFSSEAVPKEALRSVLEAARWAPSASNLQPWHIMVALKANQAAFEAMLSCLVPFNQAWCKTAPVLMLMIAKTTDSKGRPNPHAWHDVGQAAAHLTVQASTLGLYVHQMAGIESERIKSVYAVPAEHEPVSALALGYIGRPESLADEKLQAREITPRERRNQAAFVFEGRFGGKPNF
ncbi:MAG: nitroreductase [Alphaproteobacteria bacterium]|nr:nitroreductase [Alphaproteobacteria bacterium]